MPEDARIARIALLGLPNAGKSTLVGRHEHIVAIVSTLSSGLCGVLSPQMNQICGAEIALVTHKAQTTRVAQRGINTHESTQIVLIDTPGALPNSAGIILNLIFEFNF